LDCLLVLAQHSTYLAWAEVRDNGNTGVDWIIAGYENGSKTDIGVLQKGSGGVSACASSLPETDPCFGGFRLSNGRFRCFYYAPEGASVMKKGRASMHKNGVLNVMEGCDGEVVMKPDLKEEDI
jgi:Cofilin/tropomyosin-type actin-binding protein